ncbi:MAG: type II toxin-antitoxin system HicA family toxin [Candidatus Micrarchaeota archaeon]
MKQKLPAISGKQLIKMLVKKVGYSVHDQKGSHVHLRHPVKQALTIPNHPIVSKGVLNEIIKQLEMKREEFLNLLKK